MNNLFKLTAGLAALSLVYGCTKPETHDARVDPQAVIILKALPGSGNQQAFTGVVTARVQSDLGFRVGGKVTERLVDVGQVVRKGQPLMKIDPIDLNLATTSQRAAVAAAKANQVQAAADLARLDGLVEQGAISAQAFDLAKATADTAKARLAAAEAEANVALNAGNYAVLFADVDGVVVTTLAEPGQVVTAGQIVVKLAKEGPREAAINLPEVIRPTIGSDAKATLYGTNSNASPAKLRELSDSADPLTRTFSARYVLQGQAAKAPLGSTITVRLEGKEDGKIVVPLGALYDSGQGTGVWVFNIKTSAVNFRKVEVDSIAEESASISNGLSQGEQIIALGAHLLHEGEVVRPVESRLAAR